MVGQRQEPHSNSNLEQPQPSNKGDLIVGSETSPQALGPRPLAVILSASDREVIVPGSVFTLGVTISNKGRRSAIFDVSIDDRATVLQQWCLSSQERLALDPDQSGEVFFPIRVPNDAVPGIYPYWVTVDAQGHYPEDTPVQFAQQLQVLPGTQDIAHSSDPTFLLQPRTTPQAPALLQPGGALPVQVLVHNRSDRVDRFRLVCTDLPPSWFSITYPQGVQGLGLVMNADSLNLNPGEQSLISLVFTPPIDALAGSYIPTLRLYSANDPELVLLDLVYLQVQPIYLLQVELRTLISRVRQQAGIYQVRLHNLGNTQREVLLRCQNLDEEDLCSYTLDQTHVQINPKELISIGVQVQPKKWWRRPLFGGGRVLNFSVDLEDTRQLPLTVDNLPGFLLWEARPWWQILPLILLGILGILAIVYLFWWWLFRVPPPPQIMQFFSEDAAYTAVNEDVVRLGWQISEPQRVQSLTITGLSPDGKPLTRPEVYDWSQGIPPVLKPFCTQTAAQLECRNVRTSARQPGTYQFEMVIQPKAGRGATTITGTTKPVTIAPLPQPTILTFTSTQPTYQEPPGVPPTSAAPPSTAPSRGEIRLNWEIANPTQLRSLQLIGRTTDGIVVSPLQQFNFSQGLPPELKDNCFLKEKLICQNVRTTVEQPGDYVFELTATPKTVAEKTAIAQKTEVIKILPKPPRILEFTLNGKPALPKYVIPIMRNQPLPEFLLSWRVDASVGTKVTLLPAPGNVPLTAAIPLVLSPQPGSVTVVLQVTSPTGQQVTQSVVFETVDPTDPAVAAAAAAAKAIAEAQQAGQAKNTPGQPNAPGQPNGAPGLNAPRPAVPGTLSPVELPPQFDRR